MRTHRVVTVLVVLGALALGGCTVPNEVGDVPTTSPATEEASPQEQITALLTELATSSDPDQCSEAYTEKALEQALGSTDVEACRQAVAAATPADEATVDQVVVDGDTATARVAAVGGDSGGIAQVVDLVRSDDGWRFDGHTALEIVDRGAVDARFSELVQAAGPGLMPPDDVACVDARMTSGTDAELVQVLSTGSSSAMLVDAIRDCVGGGIDLTAILFLSSYQLVQAGLTQGQADCVAGLAVVDYGELTLDDIVTDPAAKEQWLQGLRDAGEYGADDVGADSSVCAKA